MADWDDEYEPDDDLVGLYVHGHQKVGPTGPIETDKAYLWVLLNGREEWIPKSQTINISSDCIQITDWLADKKGWTDNINRPDEPRQEPEQWDLNDDIPF